MIFITGGLGYIGSHVAALFAQKGETDIVLLDNLINSNICVLETLLTLYPQTHYHFYQGDIRDRKLLDTIFQTHPIHIVIHMAALKAVAESFSKKEEYESVNVGGTVILLDAMEAAGCTKCIFSSSATVYGTAIPPLTEMTEAGVGIANPYGQTKWDVEQLLNTRAPTIQSVILRYFNPIGAHPTGKLGENPNGIPNNLFPVLLKALRNSTPVTVYGNDWSTRDGTCVRDYIDIQDLAEAHFCAVQQMDSLVKEENPFVCNIGTGRGTTVLEMLNYFKEAIGMDIPYRFGPRRDGDLAEVVASIDIHRISKLKWSPVHTIHESCINAWNYKN